ncbi:MAG: ABC-ATPase domain-containing protein [Thermodesulfobacteriota bacterium]|nr:ABC-ATPase domain-containing protein [Thermodesulfobacteriota bacterium]
MPDQYDFEKLLKDMDRQAFNIYGKLLGLVVSYPHYSVHFKHIQGSPGASPASFCQVDVSGKYLQIPEWAQTSSARITAAEDYILRTFNEGVAHHAQQNRGEEGSGSFQTVSMPQQVLKRNIVQISGNSLSLAFRISLPGSLKKKVLYEEIIQMFNFELPAILLFIKEQIAKKNGLKRHCECVEDMLTLQDALSSKGLVAFVGDGSLLPRESGVSDLPARYPVVPFVAPRKLAVVVDLPNAGKIGGMGIRPGITTLIGGGYHGKSTLLTALTKSIYPHIPGDGREQVVANRNSVQVCAEDGRSIKGLDISSFFSTLPQDSDPGNFFTENASGSTSEAATVIEYVLAGAKLLLIDEDSSAANFLYRDRHLRELIPEDPIIPLFDRVRELYDNYGVSTLIIASGSSNYFGVADHVIAMREYLPVDMTARAKALNLQAEHPPGKPLSITDRRILSRENFNPEYINKRLRKAVPVRIKPLRGQEREIIEYGMDRIDVRCLHGIVDPDQIFTIGYFLLLARRLHLHSGGCSPTVLAGKLLTLVREKGLGILQPPKSAPVFFAQINMLEVAGALNRLRSLSIHADEE